MTEPPIPFEDALAQFKAYAEYIGVESVDELDTDRGGLTIHVCKNCETTIPVSASDPQAYGPVLCSDCGAVTKGYPLRRLKD